jgi:hypothetical protein
MARYPAEIAEFMQTYGVRDSEVWAVPGGKAYAVKHSALERIAAEKRIEFMPPQIVEGNTSDKTVTLIIYAQMGDIKVWSFGEVNPSNCKNAYVWSMAEKRGKDRCILKLLNIHGVLYSGEELDNTDRDDAPAYVPPGDPVPDGEPLSAHAMKRDFPEEWPELERDVRAATNRAELTAVWNKHRERRAKWPKAWREKADEMFSDRAGEVADRSTEDLEAAE